MKLTLMTLNDGIWLDKVIIVANGFLAASPSLKITESSSELKDALIYKEEDAMKLKEDCMTLIESGALFAVLPLCRAEMIDSDNVDFDTFMKNMFLSEERDNEPLDA